MWILVCFSLRHSFLRVLGFWDLNIDGLILGGGDKIRLALI
jgi:hypothetical protein